MPMDDFMKASVAGGVASGASSLMGGLFSLIGAKKQRAYENQMFDKNVQVNRENWEMENLYNSPEAQMQRLKKAGLNPNLVYGNGATAMGGSIDGSSPSVSDQSGAYTRFADALAAPVQGLNMLYDLRMKNAQTNYIDQQRIRAITDGNLNLSKTILTDILADKANIENIIGRKTMQQVIKMATLNLRQGLAGIHKTQADTEAATRNAELAGSRKEGQDISNKMQQMEYDLYKDLGLPPGAIDQILKTFPMLGPVFKLFNSGKSGKGK